MQIQPVQNQQNFNGNIIVDGLSKKQQKVYEKIQPVISEMLKNKNYDLFIKGNAKPDLNCIYRIHNITPRYVNFLTLPQNGKMEPRANSFSGSFDPEIWITHVKNLIIRHERSPYYEPTSSAKPKTLTDKVKNFLTNIFSSNKG